MPDAPLPFNVLCPARYGQLLCNRHDVYVGASIMRYGEFSDYEAQLFRRVVPVDGIVVEAGANIGALTVPLAQHVGPGGRVFAYEPQRLAFQLLNANVALNSLANVVTRQAAVGAGGGRLGVVQLDPQATNNVGGLDLRMPVEGPTEPVPVVTLDADLGAALARFDLLKADVEGAELDVLLGARELIQHHRPVLYLEADRQEHLNPMLDVMRVYGYPIQRVFLHRPPLFHPENFGGKPDNIFVQNGAEVVSINLLAFHGSWEELPDLSDVPHLVPLLSVAKQDAAA